MSQTDRERWERKYAVSTDPHRSAAAAATIDWIPVAGPGMRALDIACGAGRNARALAERGYLVVAGDIARGALHDLRAEPRIFPVQVDADHWPFKAEAFDVAVQVDFLDRRHLSNLLDCVRIGGYLLIDTFMRSTAPNPSGPRNAAFRLEPGELARIFSCWEVLETQETDESAGQPARAAALARKR